MSVNVFNKLPRSPRAPSGLVPNVWHFDIRFIQIQPPSHMVFLLQPESSFIHTQVVPVGGPLHLGFAFFPDTAKEAAPEIAKALIHAFVTGMGAGKFEKNPPLPYAPWSFTTDDRGLATEVGVELKRLGVKAPELCNVKFLGGKITAQAKKTFAEMFRSMTALTAPDSISFSYFKLTPWVEQKSGETDAALAYTQRLNSARLLFTDQDMDDLMKEVQVALKVLKRRHSAEVLTRADAGDPQAALEYSLRLQYGIQCTPSRSLCRQYLIKMIANKEADDTMKSIAHSLLIEWYVKAIQGDSIPARYLHAAAHSADEAVRLASGVPSPAVLFFALYVLEKQASHAVELSFQYEHVWKAKHMRELEIAEADNKATLKRMKQPNRYVCANVDCSVSSNSGRMLSQCSGKCDQDKKPSYCGKACQRADWKNHKPFCSPGAPCSVIDREVKGKGYTASKGGSIEVPIKNPDGTTTMVSSSTMSAEMLKELKADVEAAGGSSPRVGFGAGLTVMMGRLNVGDDSDPDPDSEID
ncbi:hypothetical protein DFH09DRAFT_1019685 [Mycena vulgaris]|nr:hypothetical protein DFH09DRAFT_1019685 [Mycena vulgaris]